MKKMVFVKNPMNIASIAKKTIWILITHIFATKKPIPEFRNQNLPDFFKFFFSYQLFFLYKKPNQKD